MERHGGLVTLADLRDYAVVERQALTGSYRGYDIITAPPPSSGGPGILQMLGVLEGSGYEKSGAGSAAELHYAPYRGGGPCSGTHAGSTTLTTLTWAPWLL